MIFNITNGPGRKVPILDPAYPQNVTVTDVGTSATFQVVISKDGIPDEYTYQWYYDGTAVSGATSDSYTRGAEFGSHTVYCVVTSKAGSVTSRTATVKATKEYFYKAGDACTSVTGGWVAKGLATRKGKTAKAPTLKKNTTNMRATMQTDDGAGLFRPSNLIDLTKYKTLYFDMAVQPKLYNIVACVVFKDGKTYLGPDNNLTSDLYKDTTAVVKISHQYGQDIARKTYSLNVSSISGKYVVGVHMHDEDATDVMGVDFYNMWGE